MATKKTTGSKLADMMYGNPEGAAFGVFPQAGKRGQAKPSAREQLAQLFTDDRAIPLPQFGDNDLSVPSAANRAMGQRMVERDVDLKRQSDQAMSPLEKLAGGMQTGRLIGSGMLQAVKSIPTAVTKGGKAAEDYIAENIYKPTQPKAYEYAEDVGNFLQSLESDYKIPPIIPEAMVFQNLVGPATRQAGRAAQKGARQGALNLMAPSTLNPQAGSVRVGPLSAPQKEALRLAQQRAALPIEQGGLGLPANNTPEQRAAAMGFDRDTYHGSLRDIKKLDPSLGSTESHAGKGVYSTDSPEDASLNYASIYGPDVTGRVERGMEDRDKDFRKIYGRMRDEVLTPRQQEIILRNTVDADNLGVVYPLRVRADKSIHLDAPEANPVRIGPFESYDEVADAYVDTPQTAKFREALDEFGELGGEANPIYEVVQDNDGPVPARDVFNAVKKTGNETGLYDPYTGDIVSGGVAAGDFVKHFGIDEIRHTPEFRNQQLNIGNEHTISLNPDNVRSRFAAFDPFRKDVATAAAMGVLAPDLLAKEKGKDEDKKKDKETKKARGGPVHFSDNPDVMRLELAGGGIVRMGVGGAMAKTGTKGGAKAAKEAAVPLTLPRVRPSTQEILEAAERVGKQQAGEFVRSPLLKDTTNLAGRSKKEVERLKELEYKVTPIKNLPEVKPYEARVGEVNIVLPGDQTISDMLLESVDGVPIGTTSEGGALFGRGRLADPEDTRAFWSSNIGPAEQFQKKVTELAELYNTDMVTAYHLAMGQMSNNFAQHMADASMRAIDYSKLNKDKMNAFDRVVSMGYVDPKTKERVTFENWPGIADPEASLQAMKEDPKLRKWFVNRMKTEKVTKPLDLPYGKSIEYAMTEPELRNMEINLTGLSAGRMKPGAELIPDSAHQTYSHDIPGTALGRAPELSPFSISFPDATAFVREKYRPQDFTGTIQKVFPHQVVDEAYLDDMYKYYTQLRAVRGYAGGGEVHGLSTADLLYLQSQEDLGKLPAHAQREAIANMGGQEVRQRMAGKYAGGGEITADDLILEERKL
jgi:hypothetical protein